MQEVLIRKLYDYIRENNPDLLATLEEENRLTDYLQENTASVDGLIKQLLTENKPPSQIEELCMAELTKQLKPSRFNYLKTLLEEEFQKEFVRLHESGILTTELINMIAVCDPVFDELNFSQENEDDRHLRYAITGAVYEYLNKE
jgi:hypothetical protein